VASPTFVAEPARKARSTELVELAAALRRALVRRGERLANTWPEEAAADLLAGRLEGIVLREHGVAVGLGVLSFRAHRAFGQIHIGGSREVLSLARSAVDALVARASPEIERIDLGVTGLSGAEEGELGAALGATPGFGTIRRFGLLRTLELDHPPPAPRFPTGLQLRPIREVPLRELGALDWEAFQGSPDAALLSDSLEGNLRLLTGIVGGQLGRFLEEASLALVDARGTLVGSLLTVEESPRVGVFVDLAVRPSLQRQGVGRALLLRGLRALLALGHVQARLWVTETNRPARALYDSLGFVTEATAYIYRWLRP
jgi:GNAT superfamily N-acetyltransferase